MLFGNTAAAKNSRVAAYFAEGIQFVSRALPPSADSFGMSGAAFEAMGFCAALGRVLSVETT